MKLSAILTLLSVLLLASFAQAAEPANLLRNGSFEGGVLYWHNLDLQNPSLVDEAKVGQHALRLEKGYIMSAPVALERGGTYTVSFWVKGDRPGTVGVQLPPSAREVGQKHQRLWTDKATQSAKIDTTWKRLSFTFKADVPQDGFWPNPHYMVLIGAGKVTPMTIDGVTLVAGTQGTDDYLPRRELEVLAECVNLPGFAGASGNMFNRGDSAELVAHVSNPTANESTAQVVWQLYDYEGERSVGEATMREVKLGPGKSEKVSVALPLKHAGCVIARASIVRDGKVIDSSDFPLTSLPYPKAATRPDWRERFGGSFAGGTGCVDKFQRLGFGWIRWRPHANGEDHLPVAPKPGEAWQWTWFDKALDEQEARGCSSHIVLYPPPKWIMQKGHPLPTDMRWPADDKRWQDLSVETTWDKFVKEAVTHYRNRSVIFEIENEPELDRWTENKLSAEYAQFTTRTARLIKQTDPAAKVMINNLYGIPSGLNSHIFKLPDGLKHIDVVSWHDYHAGWLTDATGMKRMRQNLDAAGGKHVEIWFNEGWAFTNTLVDEPPACTGLTSAQNTNAMLASLAEITAVGQEKTVLFHVAYETHGQSFWDYSGPGTMLWDWYNQPLPTAAALNVMAHHIGISDEVGWVRPVGGNFAIYQDLRNGRGVVIAYADQKAKEDVTIELPAALKGLVVEDIMGNAQALEGNRLTLSKSGRIYYLYDRANASGAELLKALEPLDRKHQGFVTTSEGKAVYRLPQTWEGETKDAADNNPVMADGKPLWRLDQLTPKADRILPASYKPLVWKGTQWGVTSGGQGGHPSAIASSGSLKMGILGPWSGPGTDHQKVAALVFMPPKDGVYRVTANISAKKWEGGAKTYQFVVLKKDTQRLAEVKQIELASDGTPVALEAEVDLTTGHELVLMPLMPHYNNGVNWTLEGVEVAER